jgi:hypothetical protein
MTGLRLSPYLPCVQIYALFLYLIDAWLTVSGRAPHPLVAYPDMPLPALPSIPMSIPRLRRRNAFLPAGLSTDPTRPERLLASRGGIAHLSLLGCNKENLEAPSGSSLKSAIPRDQAVILGMPAAVLA